MSLSLADQRAAFYAGALGLTPAQVAASSLSDLEGQFYTRYPGGLANAGASEAFTAGGEIVPRRQYINNSSITLAAGKLYLTYFTAITSETITKIEMQTGATAETLSTLTRYGVYSIDAAGNGTLVASIPNDTAIFSVTNTVYLRTLSAPWAKIANQRYALAALIVTAGVAPGILGVGPVATSNFSSLQTIEPKICGTVGTGLTDLPGSFTAGQVIGQGQYPAYRLVP